MPLRLTISRFGKYVKGDIIDVADEKHMRKRYPQTVEEIAEVEPPVSPPELIPGEPAVGLPEEVPELPEPEGEPEVGISEPEPELGPKVLDPGERVAISGQYVQVARNHRVMNDAEEATLTAGEPAPPTDKEDWRWKLADATKHRR